MPNKTNMLAHILKMRKESKGTLFAWLRPAPSKWLIGAAIHLLALNVQAAGLGAVRGEAIIGEPLYVEIPILGLSEASVSADCFRISRPVQATDAENFPLATYVKLIKRGGESFVAVATRQIVRTPIVEFRVELGCDFNVSREYLFLASPQPITRTAPATDPAPSTAPVITQATPAAHAAEKPDALPDGLTAKSHTLERSMRLDELARIYFPSQPLRSERFMRWVVEANPLLFQGASSLREHQLKKGAAVLVPLAIPPRRPGDHKGNHGRLKFLDPATDQPAPVQKHIQASHLPPPKDQPAGKPRQKQDRLQISGGASNSSQRWAKPLSLLTERLGELEGAQAADREKVEERLKHLESTIAQLSSYVVKLEAKAKEQEALLKAEREDAQSARASLQLMQLLLAILGGGLIGVLLLTILQKKRKKEFTQESLAPMPEIVTTDDANDAALAESASIKPAPFSPPPTDTLILPASPAPMAEAAPISLSQPSPPKPASSRSSWDFEPVDLDVEAPPIKPPAQHAPSVSEFPDEARITLELVDVLISMGQHEEAAKTLLEHTHKKPRQSPLHWLKLLDLFREEGKKEDFERTANEIRQHFNIHPPEWEAPAPTASLEDYPHIIAVLCQLWNADDCENFLYDLITDNRGGARDGFPLSVAEEILLLIAILTGESYAKD